MIYEYDNEYKQLSPEGSISATQSIGTIALWLLPKITIPHGWLLCDGSEYDIDKYKELYELSGDNHTPNLTGDYILQGTTYLAKLNKLDMTSGMPNATGTWGYAWSVRGGTAASAQVGTGIFRGTNHGNLTYNATGSDNMYWIDFDSSRVNNVYQDTDKVMPKTIEIFYIIKALDTSSIYEWIEENVKIDLGE